jgi:ADP-ribosylglycohydrolase
MTVPMESRVAGCLLGTAVGDAIGLPYEGLPARRAARLLGPPTQHRLWWRGGMVSDDTEHMVMTAQAWLAAKQNAEVFARNLASRLRWWFARVPAGIGKATLMACVRLWLGASPAQSGSRSAGNGAAMRAPLLGVLAKDTEELVVFVNMSSRMTHRHVLAEQGAIIIALAAHVSFRDELTDVRQFVERSRQLLGDAAAPEILQALHCVAEAIANERFANTPAFVAAQGWQRGASGYILHTLPAVLHAWWLHPTDYRAAIVDIIEAGGDADSTAALVGGIIGARVGDSGIPDDWLNGLRDAPCSVAFLRKLAVALSAALRGEDSVVVPEWSTVTILARNAMFVLIVLMHGFRRLAPPY